MDSQNEFSDSVTTNNIDYPHFEFNGRIYLDQNSDYMCHLDKYLQDAVVYVAEKAEFVRGKLFHDLLVIDNNLRSHGYCVHQLGCKCSNKPRLSDLNAYFKKLVVEEAINLLDAKQKPNPFKVKLQKEQERIQGENQNNQEGNHHNHEMGEEECTCKACKPIQEEEELWERYANNLQVND